MASQQYIMIYASTECIRSIGKYGIYRQTFYLGNTVRDKVLCRTYMIKPKASK